MKYDEIYEHIGELGPFQICCYAIIMLFSIWGTEVIGMNFVAGELPHWCYVPALTNFSFEQQREIAIPDDGDSYSSCSVYNLNYSDYTREELIKWNRTLMTDNTDTVDCSSWVYDQSTFVMTTVNRFNLVCGKQALVQLPATMFMVGVLIGVVMSGALSDKFGRRTIILVYLTIKVIGAGLSIAEFDYIILLVGRLILGLGNSGCFLCTYVLMAELVGPKYRTFVGVTQQMAFSVGFMLQGVIAYFIRHDVKFQAASMMPFILFFLFFFVLPESPRWLIVQERYDDANKLIEKMARTNGKPLPDNFDSRKVEIEMNESENKGNCLDLLKTRRMRIRTIVMDFAWFTSSLVYYAMSLNVGELSGNIYLNTVISGSVEIPANILCILLLDWKLLGRRFTCSGSLIAAGIFSFANIPLILYDYGTAATTLSMIGKAAITISFSVVYVYSSELFPTEVRNVGMGTASMWARVAGTIAPYVGGPLNSLWEPMSTLVFGVVSTVSGISCLLLPETLGMELLDTIEEAEHFKGSKKKKTDSVPHKYSLATQTKEKNTADDVTGISPLGFSNLAFETEKAHENGYI